MSGDVGLDQVRPLTHTFRVRPQSFFASRFGSCFSRNAPTFGQVSYYRESLAWTNDDVASMLEVYPKFLSIKMENDVVEVIDYLR